jgi:repressor LexA
MKELSPRQKQILRFIETFYTTRGYPPTIREIQGQLKPASSGKPVSTSVVDYNLNILEERNHIRRNRHISRGIELVNLPGNGANNRVAIPVLGQIAAGTPIEVPDDLVEGEFAENIEISIDLLPQRTDNLFALRVKGKSMIDALVDDGDLVVLRRQETAENGEAVAVWLKEERETTLKLIYREGPRIRLQPANSTMDPIYTRADNVEIKGRLVSVHRTIR